MNKISEYKKRYSHNFRELGSLKSRIAQSLGTDIENDGIKVDKYLHSLSKNNQKLSDAIKIGSQADQDARDIKLGLSSQTDKLSKMSNNVVRTQYQLSISNRLVDTIWRNETKNKLILYWVILSLIVGIGVLIYFLVTK